MKFNPSARFLPANAGRALGRSVNAHRALANTDYRYPLYHDGRMAKGFLYNLEQDARSLQEVLKDEDDIPQWVNWKIYTSADRLQAAARYMEREARLLENPKRRPFRAVRNGSPTERGEIPPMKSFAQMGLKTDEVTKLQGILSTLKGSLASKTGASADNIGFQKVYDHMPAEFRTGWNQVIPSNASRQQRDLMVEVKRKALWRGHDGLIPVLQAMMAAKASDTESGADLPSDEEVLDVDGTTVASVSEESSNTWIYLAAGALVVGTGLFFILRRRKKS